MKKSILVLGLLLVSSLTWGHTRLTFPVPRSNSSGIKVGPCGGLAKSNTPMAVTGGQVLTIKWEETIQHPGKFIISMATANDVGFNQNILATIPDTQDDPNNLPHEFQAQITVPDIDCPTCTLQMIQSMEENPAAPSYYYSCADIAITKTVAAVLPIMPPSSGGSEGTLASTNPSGSSGVKFGQGCGLVKDTSTNPPMDLKWVFLCMITLLIPVLTWKKLKILVTTT